MATKKLIEKKEGCIEEAMHVLGTKWTALLLRELMNGPMRFFEFQKALPTLNPRTLSQRLDALETMKIIKKQIFAEVPPRVEYTLSPKGNDLLPILQQMAEWGYKHGKN